MITYKKHKYSVPIRFIGEYMTVKENGNSLDIYYNTDLIVTYQISDKFLNMSIKDNLKLVNDNFGNIVYVCKKLGIHNDISQLKYGYDTILNSKDDTLKPNTKIMLNIARILLKNTKVMIFDEILSSLNNENKRILLEQLSEMKKNHTIIIIDNNEAAIEISDNIVLLNDSEVVETGTADNIIKNKTYKNIINE